jgi:hypothetical protein
MSHHRFHSSAPLGVKTLAVLTAVDGLQSLVRALELLGVGAFALGLPLAVVATMHLALAYGLWQLEPYAYALGMALFGVAAVLDFASGSPVGAVTSLTTLSMLYHYRGLFRR